MHLYKYYINIIKLIYLVLLNTILYAKYLLFLY